MDSKESDLLEIFSGNWVISFLEAGLCNPPNPVFSEMGELEASFISENRRGSIFFTGYSGADRTWWSRYSANTLSTEEVS